MIRPWHLCLKASSFSECGCQNGGNASLSLKDPGGPPNHVDILSSFILSLKEPTYPIFLLLMGHGSFCSSGREKNSFPSKYFLDLLAGILWRLMKRKPHFPQASVTSLAIAS